jgi:hypothetical protein
MYIRNTDCEESGWVKLAHVMDFCDHHNKFSCSYIAQWGHALALLVEALCYKPEGCAFDSR